MNNLYFATGNKNKGIEIQEWASRHHVAIEVVTMDFAEPEVNDIETVSRSKAQQAYQVLQEPVFVIDSGLNIYHYPGNPGFPGAFVRRSGISDNVDLLLDAMKGVKDRSCRFLDCLTYYDGKEFRCFYGIDDGIITTEKRGVPRRDMRSELWYVFQPEGFDRTLGEMTEEENIARRDGKTSAKEAFIDWYKAQSKDQEKCIKL